MRKLTKLNLEEMIKTMSVVPKEELSGYVGMYDGDCFWRCVAYLNTGSWSEEAAASFALSYWTNAYGANSSGADYQLSTYGAGMSLGDARNYVNANNLGRKILYINPDNISYYQNNGYSSYMNGSHAVILESSFFGGYNVYDPQSNTRFTISTSESATSNGTYVA